MGYQSEAQLEKHLVEQLQTQGYEAVQLSDYATVLANFRTQLNKFNEKKLNGQPLTDKEFKRVLVATEDKSIYESAKILRDKLLIEREDGTELYLELMNTKQWCKTCSK